MGERAAYEHGTPNWVELGTDEPEAACSFYSELFGWEGEEIPGGHGSYTMFRLGGKKVAGILARGEKQPVNAWNSYIAVNDADVAAARVAELGGTVAAGPFDLPGAGRAAFVLDPSGAAVGLWEAREHFGAELVNEPGALCMNQLNSRDPEAALTFFVSLFGWRVEDMGTEDLAYWGFFRDDTMASMNATMTLLPPDGGAPSHWLAYFAVSDVEASTAKAKELGGGIDLEAEIEDGRIAVLTDPQGAYFALFEGELDP